MNPNDLIRTMIGMGPATPEEQRYIPPPAPERGKRHQKRKPKKVSTAELKRRSSMRKRNRKG